MRGSGKKTTEEDTQKSSPSDTVNGSLLIKSLKIKKGSKFSLGKSQKPKSHLKSKTIVTPKKGIGSGSTSKKLIHRKIVHKALDKKSSRKLTSSELQGKLSSTIGSEDNGKTGPPGQWRGGKGERTDGQFTCPSRVRFLPCAPATKLGHGEWASRCLRGLPGRAPMWAMTPGFPRQQDNGKTADESSSVKKLKKKRKPKKKKKDILKQNEPSRLHGRARYLIIKMKLEQNLIDAYSGEGWKGQSREKIRPEKELLRAKKQILKCKLGIRDVIRQLDSLSTVGCIEDTVMAPDGSVSHEHIFCAKCKLNEVSPDNDIVLCDGTCNCAFHQKCLDPPLDTENIPPGDQGWFCKFCECRMEIIESMNAHLGTHFSEDSSWQDIFKEEAAFPDGGNMLLNPEEEWPSDDSEDDDYDPEKRENSTSGAGTDDDASNDYSSSTSLGWSSDGEDYSGSREWEMDSLDFRNHTIYSSLDLDETSDGEIICGRRHRRAVDYKKLYDEMFGKDAPAHEQASEDEDWGPAKRKRREKESDAASTLMTLHESEEKCKNHETVRRMMKHSQDSQIRRPFFRLPPNAVEKLRQVFAENELPSRAVKENLSKELGLEPRKVNKWFKNARYLALKSRKVEKGKQHNSGSKISEEPKLNVMKDKNAEFAPLKDARTETILHTPQNLKRILQRKKPKSICRSLKKNELRRGSLESPTKCNEVSVEYSDDMSLKKLLKAKTKVGKKKGNSLTGAAEAEMERLCRAKVRLESMQQTLARLRTGKARKSSKTRLVDESVVYIPIAELREKI